MKFLSILLITALAATSALAAPQPGIFDVGAGIAQNIGDAITGGIQMGGNIASGAVDTARDIASSGINIASSVGTGVTSGITGTIVGGLNSLQDISNKITQRITDSTNEFTNHMVKGAVDQVKARLADIESRSLEALQKAEQTLSNVQQNVDDKIQQAVDTLTAWADQKVVEADEAGVSDETKEQIQNIVDGFVQSSTENAHQCADSILKPIQSMRQNITETVQQSLPLIEDLLDQIEVCAAGNQSNTRSISSCVGAIREKLMSLSSLPSKYAKLLSQLSRVSINSLAKSPCVSQGINKALSEQKAANEKIAELMKKDTEPQSS